jgi:hypothetical protein
MFFNIKKREFSNKYPGCINVLNNIFGTLEIKYKYLEDEMYLYKNALVGNQKLQMYFYVTENNKKLEKIKHVIDFDYYILNKKKAKGHYDLSKKIDFKEFMSTQNTYTPNKWLCSYIEYLNDLSIKNHLLSKYKGDHILGAHSFGVDSRNAIRRNVASNPFSKGKYDSLEFDSSYALNNPSSETVYDALGSPKGIVNYGFEFEHMLYNDAIHFGNNYIPQFEMMQKNPQILHGYKHKSNFILHLEIKLKDSSFYQDFLLLDSNDVDSLELTDYENIKNKLAEFLESFERSATHKNLSNNLNVGSLVYELTGKNYLKQGLNYPINSNNNNSVPNNSLEYMNSTLIPIRKNMCLYFNTEIGKFESNGYNLIHGNFLCPPDHIILLDAIKLVEEALWNSLAGLVAEVGDQSIYGKFLLDKWDDLIDESKQEELQKFLSIKNIKLIKFHDEPNDDSSLYL